MKVFFNKIKFPLITALLLFFMAIGLLSSHAGILKNDEFQLKLEEESSEYLDAFARHMKVECDSTLTENQKNLFDTETKRALYYLYLSRNCGKTDSQKKADYYMGLAFFKKENMKKAKRYLESAVKNGFDTPLAHYYLGRALFKTGQYTEAVTAYQKTIDHKDNNEVFISRAEKAIILAKASAEAEKSAAGLHRSPGSIAVKKNTNEILLVPYDKRKRAERLSKFNSKILILHFWATWCQPCLKEFPDLIEVYKKYRAKGLTLVTASQDYDISLVNKFLKENSYPNDFPVFYDQGGRLVLSLTQSIGIPATIIFNDKGKAIKTTSGMTDWKDPQLIALVEKSLNIKMKASQE